MESYFFQHPNLSLPKTFLSKNKDVGMDFLSWCRHLLVPFLFHDVKSLHPPSFHTDYFLPAITCTSVEVNQGTQEDSVVAKDPEKEKSFLSLCLEQKLKNRSMIFSRDEIELSTIIGQGVCVCLCVYILSQ